MSTLQAELSRLYLRFDANSPNPGPETQDLLGPGGNVRALVLELARPAEWEMLAPLWRGVQADLELPAPAIAVSGVDAYQLWFSLAQPIPVAQAGAFLDYVCSRYLSTVAPGRIRFWPAIGRSASSTEKPIMLVPALQAQTGRWSAFVAPDLAAIFSDEPWLDLAPSADAQASVLSRLTCIKPAAFQAVLDRIGTMANATSFGQTSNTDPKDHVQRMQHGSGAVSEGQCLDPKRFLLDVMGDQTVELHLRIAAATALLPYTEGH